MRIPIEGNLLARSLWKVFIKFTPLLSLKDISVADHELKSTLKDIISFKRKADMTATLDFSFYKFLLKLKLSIQQPIVKLLPQATLKIYVNELLVYL